MHVFEGTIPDYKVIFEWIWRYQNRGFVTLGLDQISLKFMAFALCLRLYKQNKLCVMLWFKTVPNIGFALSAKMQIFVLIRKYMTPFEMFRITAI